MSACSPEGQSADNESQLAYTGTSNQSIDKLVRSACGSSVVMLGESGFHGDGETIAMKVQIVKELVDKCDFNTVLIEASFYDSQAISMAHRNGKEVSLDMVSSALGFARSKDDQIAPLIPFLVDGINSGNIQLGGLDDQLGGRGSFYSLEKMLVELAQFMDEDQQELCYDLLKQRVWYSFPNDQPYTEKKRENIRQCLRNAKKNLADKSGISAADKNDYLAMLANIDRSLGRDFIDSKEYVPARDRSMYENLEWISNQAQSNRKIIVWSTNDHVAKSVAEGSAFGDKYNLGSFVHEKYPESSFSIGFTALTGSYRYTFGENKSLPEAPKNSLEHLAIKAEGPHSVYLNTDFLTNTGDVPGALFYHKYSSNNWSNFFDGIIVLKTEQPATRPE